VLDGEGTMIFEDHEVILGKGQGLEITSLSKQQFKNNSQAEVHFLVISVPSTRGDRVNL
jgi:mannose-6-phosphate isomerase-like protein (cupin superfamily)